MRTDRHAGFTLVELLVVIAIIGILVALLLPAVQSAREAARAMQCRNNLKQLALALHNYHDAHKTFPPSVQFAFGQDPAASVDYRTNWVIKILPFLEEQNTYNLFDLTKPISDNVNRTARGTPLSVMLCPSDVNQNIPFAGISGANEGDRWARGNYAANGTNGYLALPSTDPMCAHCGVPGASAKDAAGWSQVARRGVMGACTSVSLAKILDGASHTMLLGEIRVGLNEYDRRGTWAMGTAGASALFGHGYISDDNGPNACNDGADDLRGCDYLLATTPGASALRSECMHCFGGGNYQATARSRHAGGVFVALCDGSIQFVSDLVYTSGAWGTARGPWDYLITCCDGAQTNPNDYE
jgi:prepilin-type N-terminal cleavage/methylation domain-containing protein